MKYTVRQQRWRLLILGTPLLVLVFASIAFTAFLAVNLISAGLGDGTFSQLVLGIFLASLWLYMFYKTIRARLTPVISKS